MFGLRAYIIVAVVVAVGGAIMGARSYYKDTQERIATLHKNNAKMEVVQQQNEAVMKSLTQEATRLNELNFNSQIIVCNPYIECNEDNGGIIEINNQENCSCNYDFFVTIDNYNMHNFNKNPEEQSHLFENIYGFEIIGLFGFTCRYLGKDNSGIHLPCKTLLDSSGVNGF